MRAIFRKELTGFFSTLTGYIAGAIFLVVVSLLMWVFPSEWNLLETGEASLSPLFQVAPWVFLFLVPAVTMRMFSDERRDGTLDLLLSRPVSTLEIVLGKFFAAVVLVIILLVPTLVFYIAVLALGDSGAPLDQGATWGSYVGLFFLAAVYAAVGIFASTLTKNAVVAFLLGALFSLVIYLGFASAASLQIFRGYEFLIANFGLLEHYQSIRRGVIDTRDLVYFLSVITLFVAGARARLIRSKA